LENHHSGEVGRLLLFMSTDERERGRPSEVNFVEFFALDADTVIPGEFYKNLGRHHNVRYCALH